MLLFAGLYYWVFLADDLNRSQSAGTSLDANEIRSAEAKQFFAMTEANIRDKATTTGSTVLGRTPRGSAVTGIVILGEDDSSEWLRLADGNGFIAMVNLGEAEPPEIAKDLNDKIWTTDAAIEIWSQADIASTLLDRVSAGTSLTLSGLTTNDFIEVKLRKGGVGYISDGAAVIARLGGKPVSIAFNPANCSFGAELDGQFAQIGATLRAQWEALQDTEFPSEEARDRAMAAAEGRSTYRKLKRSYEGLNITGIAQHYESQSVYFSDPAAKVIDLFRSKGFRVSNDGIFPSEIYAGVSATRGEEAAYGKSELGCGV